MKYTLLVFLFISGFNVAISQDVLVLFDGRIESVEITKVDIDSQRIEFVKNDENNSHLFTAVSAYKFDSQWYSKNFKTEKFELVADAPYNFRRSFLREPSKFEYKRLSFAFTVNYNLGKDFKKYEMYFAENIRLRLEPEFRLSPHISIKTSVVIGLQTKNDLPATVNNEMWNNGKGDGVNSFFADHFGYFATFNSDETSEIPNYRGRNGYRNPYIQSYFVQNNVYELGLGVKIYPFENVRRSFYISPSFGYGKMIQNAVDVYLDFEQGILEPNNQWGQPYTGWVGTTERIVPKVGEFNYLNFELAAGFNFNLSHNFNLAFETGFSTYPLIKSGLATEDIYVSTGGEYLLVNSNIPSDLISRNSAISGVLINRLFLVYKFGSKQEGQ